MRQRAKDHRPSFPRPSLTPRPPRPLDSLFPGCPPPLPLSPLHLPPPRWGLYPTRRLPGLYPIGLLRGLYPIRRFQGLYPIGLLRGLYPIRRFQGLYPKDLFQPCRGNALLFPNNHGEIKMVFLLTQQSTNSSSGVPDCGVLSPFLASPFQTQETGSFPDPKSACRDAQRNIS